MIGQQIRAIRIEELFGLYTYSLPEDGKSLRDAAILYGDNGVGKTTILKLVFHLLSPADNRSHRSALTKVAYRRLEVELTSGAIFRAEREEDVSSTEVLLTIWRGNKVLAEWRFDSNSHRSVDLEHAELASIPFQVKRTQDGKYVVVSSKELKKETKSHPRGEGPYMSELKRLAPTVFLLNADRRLDSDSVPDPSDEVQLRRVLRYEDVKRVNDLVARSREIALTQALSSATQWIGKQAVQGANRGSTNVHSVYVNVLKHLSAKSHGEEVDVSEVALLLNRLTQVEVKSKSLARYEFTPALPTAEFKKALQARARAKRDLAAKLLKPYVDSLEGRLTALEPIYQLVDTFVSVINEFLSDKALSFRLSNGFTIKNRLSRHLGAPELSSGEQQLLLLFCYVLIARDQPSVFIVDEPEISLNVKWQRKLVQSLLDITEGTQIQFVLASHSMELLAQHRSRVVKLESSHA